MDALTAAVDAVWSLLDLLNTWWLGPAVEFGAAAVVAHVAHKNSPGRNWRHLRELPERIFLIAFLMFSHLKLSHWLVNPRWRFACGPEGPMIDHLGIAHGCQLAVVGDFDEYGLLDFLADGVMNFVVELPFVLVGFVLGWGRRRVS